VKKDSENDGKNSTAVDRYSLLKKTVLLVDINPRTRESRAKVMRSLGVTVLSTSSARGARMKLDSGEYDLVLVDLGADHDGAEGLVREIKLNNPRQLVAFLVGSPLFVTTSLSGKGERRPRVLSPLRPIPVPTPKAAAKNFDFAQKVKDAEAEDVA
jgi:CheY-like chemotaxis protein